jgi:hypothetical protein
MVDIKGKTMSVYAYFAEIKKVASVNKNEKLFVVEKKSGQSSFFPLSLCLRVLPLEKGLKD